MSVKRTTLLFNSNHLMMLKKLAAEQRRTLSNLVEEMIGEGLARYDRRRRPNKSWELPTFQMGAPLIDISDRESIDALDD